MIGRRIEELDADMSLGMKSVYSSVGLGCAFSSVVFCCANNIFNHIPLFLFDISSVLSMPGGLVTLIVVSIVKSDWGLAAMHGGAPYKYISLAFNCVFYSILFYFALKYLSGEKSIFRSFRS